MGYGKKIYDEAKNELDRRRQTAEQEAHSHLDMFYRQCPRAQKVREEMAQNAAGTVRAVISGGDPGAEISKLKEHGLALRAEFRSLLSEHGLTEQDIAPRYTCPDCGDTGFLDGRMCHCFKNLQRAIAYKNLSMDIPLESCTFENFSLEYYKEDPRAFQQMGNVLRACRSYAEKFRADSPSLLFRGKTGLGKTHLSLSIANEALQRGYGVVYGSAQSLALSLEKERFDREKPDAPDGTYAQLLSCDLLILDDLGTEFPSHYVNAALYNVINSRMMARKPTIINTNLSMKELENRYSERFASRIAGYYGMLEFLGNDVRVEMRKRKAK